MTATPAPAEHRQQSLTFAVNLLRSLMRSLSPDERLDLWGELCEGYCQDCGRLCPEGHPCQCENDD